MGASGVADERSVVSGWRFPTDAPAKPAHPDVGTASGASVATLTTLRQIEREVASLRVAPGSDVPLQRTSVMTHTAWVPPEWVEAAEDVLSGLAERHPSRTIVLVPEPDAEDGIDADVEVEAFQASEGRQICAETIRIRLKGNRVNAAESVVEPLFLPDLPTFLRWRGRPDFDSDTFQGLIAIVDRLIIDSTEWPDLPVDYASLAPIFDRVMVSDIAWARTSRWRTQLASLWPGIADVKKIRVTGTAAQAHLLAGWLRSRLERAIELKHEPADTLKGVDIDGEPAPFPAGQPPAPADLLSDELDRFERDRIYEDAVRSAAQ
jgi:glucose-6-phosphate dehydrogenase assembly protein OpcA